MLHEFGRAGPASVIRVLRDIKAAFPSKLLVFVEGEPPATTDDVTSPAYFGQRTYFLIHPLSGQGVPSDRAAWQAWVEEAGMQLVAVHPIHWVNVFVARM
jgi:hypothetical protein